MQRLRRSHGGFANNARVDIRWLCRMRETPEGAACACWRRRDCRPWRPGIRSISAAWRVALGTRASCSDAGLPALGLQCMVIEAARHLAGIPRCHRPKWIPTRPSLSFTMADQHESLMERDRNNATRCIPRTARSELIVVAAYGMTAGVSASSPLRGHQCLPRPPRTGRLEGLRNLPTAHLLSSWELDLRLCTYSCCNAHLALRVVRRTCIRCSRAD